MGYKTILHLSYKHHTKSQNFKSTHTRLQFTNKNVSNMKKTNKQTKTCLHDSTTGLIESAPEN